MRLAIGVALVVAVAPLAVHALQAPQAPQAPFTIGALRRDGIVVPFATFDGKSWSIRWPRPSLDVSIPINLTSVPSGWWGKPGPRDTWQAWTGSDPKTLRVRQPDGIDVHCTRQIGLRTDYRPDQPAPPWTEQPYPKDGLAVSPPQPVEKISILQPVAPELVGVKQTLTEAFNKAERETASRFNYAIAQSRRESDNPQIEMAYAYGTTPRIYYVESSRVYRGFGTGDCRMAFGTGWFRADAWGITPLAMTVDLLQCDKYGATYMYPFGVMTIAEKIYWIAQFSGWDHERFVVVEIKPKEVVAVVNAWGGGC